MHLCFDCTNKCHSNYFIYASDRSWIGLDLGQHLVIIVDCVGLGHRVDGLDWFGFRKLDPRPTLVRCIIAVPIWQQWASKG